MMIGKSTLLRTCHAGRHQCASDPAGFRSLPGAFLLKILIVTAALPVFVLSAAMCTPAVQGQEGEILGEERTLLESMTRLDGSVKELSELMRTLLEQQQSMLDNQEIELAMRRLEMQNAQLLPLRNELSDARSSRTKLDEEHAMLQEEMTRLENALSAAEDSSDPQTAGIERGELDRFEQYVRRLGDSIWRLDQRILELEGEINDRERSTQHLQDYIDQQLGLE